MATQVSESAKQFLGVESFSSEDLETVQTLTVPNGTTFIMIQSQGNPILWHPGGDTPVDGDSFIIGVNETLCIHQTPLVIKIIRSGAGASAYVAYYR